MENEKLRDYIFSKKIIVQHVIENGFKTHVLKIGTNYPEYVVSSEQKKMYTLKCEVAYLKSKLNSTYTVYDYGLGKLGLLLYIYLDKLIIYNEEHVSFLDEIWSYIYSYVSNYRSLSEKDFIYFADNINSSQGIAKYVDFSIKKCRKKHLVKLIKVCKYLDKSGIKIHDSATQFSDLIATLKIDSDNAINVRKVEKKLNISKLSLLEQSKFYGINIVDSKYNKNSIEISHIIKINAQLYRIYRNLIDKDDQFRMFDVAYGYLVDVILRAKYRYFDQRMDFVQYQNFHSDAVFFINGSYVTLNSIISAVDLYNNWEQKDTLTLSGNKAKTFLGEYIKFCREVYNTSPIDVSSDKEKKMYAEYAEKLNSKFLHKGYANYSKIKKHKVINNDKEVSIIVKSLDSAIFDSCMPRKWCIDYVFSNNNESYIVKVFRNGSSLSNMQCEYIEHVLKNCSQKFLFVNFVAD